MTPQWGTMSLLVEASIEQTRDPMIGEEKVMKTFETWARNQINLITSSLTSTKRELSA